MNLGYVRDDDYRKCICNLIYKDSDFGVSGRNPVFDKKYASAMFRDKCEEYDRNGKFVQRHSAIELGADGIASYGGVGRNCIFTFKIGDRQVKQYVNDYSPLWADIKDSRIIIHEAIFYIMISADPTYNEVNWSNDQIIRLENELNDGSSSSGKISKVSTSSQVIYVGGGSSQSWKPPSISTPSKPYVVTLDHGQITVDPAEPRFDPGAGETGQWTTPGVSGFEYPPGYN